MALDKKRGARLVEFLARNPWAIGDRLPTSVANASAFSSPLSSPQRGFSSAGVESHNSTKIIKATKNANAGGQEYDGEDDGGRVYASPVPNEETALSELPFQATSRQNPISIFLPEDNGFSAVTITVESVGDNLSYGKILPGVGKNNPKSGGNGVDISLSGQGRRYDFFKTYPLKVNKPVTISLDVHPARRGVLTIQGTTFAEVFVTVYGLNYYPSGCCENNNG